MTQTKIVEILKECLPIEEGEEIHKHIADRILNEVFPDMLAEALAVYENHRER